MSTSQTMTEKMNLAFSYFEQRKFDAALSLFEEVAEAQPTEIDAFIGIGKIRLERGEYEAAEKAFEAARKLDDEAGVVYFHLGNLKMTQLDFFNGVKFYDQAKERGYAAPRLFYNYGLYYFGFGRYREAIECFESGLKKDPLNAALLSALCDAQLLLHDYDKADETADLLTTVHPLRYEGYYWKTEVLRRRDGNAPALDYLNDLIAEFPNSSLLYFNRARTLLKEDQFERAMEDLATCERLLKDTAATEALRAQSLTDKRFDIDLRAVRMQRVQIYGLTGDLDAMHKELLEMHDELQAQIPPVTDSFVNYGLIQLDLAAGRHASALAYLREQQQLPLTSNYRRSAGYSIGKIEALTGNPEAAEAAYRQAIDELEPLEPYKELYKDVPLILSYCHFELEDYERANQYCDQALALTPEHPDANLLKGKILEQTGQAEEAAEYLAKGQSNLDRLLAAFEKIR